ncbi:uncharacterized protein LOC112560274 [Pomacea canaliculata]|uniref:uncharacterized protein LOC112560274 n=1 Tax=Pomacea canaliculata TaxID=400727 RepID=UPI000D737975|nr:uncharacterized protein LOC112560274 [Pomacea canaliculata]
MCRQYKRLMRLDARMKLQVLIVIAAAWTTTTGATVTCADLPSCVERLNETETECRIDKDIADCLKISVGDCRRKNTPSEPKEALLTSFLKAYYNKCPGVTRSHARTCADLRGCVSEISKLSEDNHKESCRILANIRDCAHEAFADCRRNSSLPQAVEDQINLFLKEAENKCGPDAVPCPEADTCLSKRDSLTKEMHKELCRNFENTTECLQEALDDCRRNSTLSVEEEA